MSQEALDKNVNDLKEGGFLLIDGEIVKSVPRINAKVYAVLAAKIAEENFGDSLYANMVILGALNKLTNLVRDESVEKAIAETVPKSTIAINVQAYRKGKGSEAKLLFS